MWLGYHQTGGLNSSLEQVFLEHRVCQVLRKVLGLQNSAGGLTVKEQP